MLAIAAWEAELACPIRVGSTSPSRFERTCTMREDANEDTTNGCFRIARRVENGAPTLGDMCIQRELCRTFLSLSLSYIYIFIYLLCTPQLPSLSSCMYRFAAALRACTYIHICIRICTTIRLVQTVPPSRSYTGIGIYSDSRIAIHWLAG